MSNKLVGKRIKICGIEGIVDRVDEKGFYWIGQYDFSPESMKKAEVMEPPQDRLSSFQGRMLDDLDAQELLMIATDTMRENERLKISMAEISMSYDIKQARQIAEEALSYKDSDDAK